MQTNILEAGTTTKISVGVFFVAACAICGLALGLTIPATSQSLASTTSPPAISISEIMSCPSTGNKEWVELQRAQDSTTQQPLSEAFLLAGYRLEDDKTVIWTGSNVIPEPGPITATSGDPISASIGGYFSAADTFTTITLSKQYLNNTGDILKLLSPTGELLEQVTLPACPENGKSWTFNDGDWIPASPTPGQENPSPSPSASVSPSPSPSPNPSPTPQSSASISPTAKPSPPSTTISNNHNQESPSLNTSQTVQSSSEQNAETKVASKLTLPQPESYIAKINNNSQPNQTKNNPTGEVNASEILGTSHETSSDSAATQARKTTTDSNSKTAQQTNSDLLKHDLLYSPDRSILAYLSAILGGALLTTAASLLAYRSTPAQPPLYTNITQENLQTTL